jgi:hypothetical protein
VNDDDRDERAACRERQRILQIVAALRAEYQQLPADQKTLAIVALDQVRWRIEDVRQEAAPVKPGVEAKPIRFREFF